MSQSQQLIICEYCDTVYNRAPLLKHQRAVCQRCGGVLYRHTSLTVQQRLALSVTGGILLVFADYFPRTVARRYPDAVLAFGDMARSLGDRLVEAEINPLFVRAEGQGAIAADGVAILS